MWSIRSRGGKKDEARKVVILNQTWVHSLACSKDNLLTLACSEGKYSVYLQAPRKRPELPDGFQRRGFKGNGRRGFRGCDQLMDTSQIAWHHC